MKNKNKHTLLTVLALVVLGFGTSDAQQNLAQQAYAIFQQNCLNCHGEHGAFTEEIIIEHAALIETGTIIPGKPIESELYKRLLTDDSAKRMPLGQPKLSAAAIRTIDNWIQAGAPDWQMPERDTDFITPTKMLETIEKHVNSLAPFDHAFTRYFTMTHLYNAGESSEALHAYQRALSKLVNSLSWGREVIKPQPIDLEEAIFYIDLRDYEWEIGTNRWTLIEAEYPYKVEFGAPTQTALREKFTNLREAMDCEVPFVHVDWFIATASLPPLYHDILDLPQTDRELETRLEVNIVENIRNAAGRRVWRAGFNDSGVSNHNRVVERHTSRYGAYWKSYDFAGSVGTQNIFTHPLSFTHDGGEIIFNLKNGGTGAGTLLSVVFSAKAEGISPLALHNFQLGTITGDVIPAGVRGLTITVESKPNWDVNADGRVSILDLILVAQRLGETAAANSEVDINDDGVISILDLILVAQHMGESTLSASPSMFAMEEIDGLDPAMIQSWIERAQVEDDGSIPFQQGIENLQRLLASLIPEKTVLLANYPNPFNPEMWIPYQLANPSDVTITIYDTRGTIVRRLELGYQRAAHYTHRSRAAYWDGKNAIGEGVASGIYFYQLRADNLLLLRKMVILR